MAFVRETVHLSNDHTAQALYGPQDRYLHILEEGIQAQIVARGTEIALSGEAADVARGKTVLAYLTKLIETRDITESDVRYAFTMQERGASEKEVAGLKETLLITAHGKHIRPKTLGQGIYIHQIKQHTITFGIGPAGTGKTYLAVVMAVRALKRREVSRIVLTRPAVEAGEKLGFLPGDLQDKVDPYLRPLYDGLYDTLGQEVAQRYLDKGIIEIAPLAYMRGRTLDESFIILDEAQNATKEQMKMFLTRIGFGSRAVVTGDVTQIDLPRTAASGLVSAKAILDGIDEIAFSFLEAEDVVRHPVVAKIIRAYERDGALKEQSHDPGSSQA
ncbi:PhoH family protein [Peptococcus niger]|uniref:PhoH-like protein n=1 Tax=Peptococcus niger TaxID=2741 RepID=A0A1G6V0E8_PEPNI|nr:PhoH family protein [Peptococcus niger]SDD47070.1 phosphate starvation-inducible protein PhoH [Peptococcus niger]